MVAAAQEGEIPQLVHATSGLLDDVMDLEISSRAAARYGATMVIAREYLLADPWRHGGRGSLGRGRIE